MNNEQKILPSIDPVELARFAKIQRQKLLADAGARADESGLQLTRIISPSLLRVFGVGREV
jgi:hypothetical protein